MNFLYKIKSWLYNNYFYYGIEDSFSSEEKEFKVIINQYSFVMFMVLFMITIFNLTHFNFGADVIFITFLMLFFALNPYLFQSVRTSKVVIYIITVVVTLIINYYSHYSGLESGVFLYFLPLIITVVILFNDKKIAPYFYLLMIFIVINMYSAVVFEDFNFIKKSNLNGYEKKALQLLNLTCILVVKTFIYFIIVDRRERYNLLKYRNLLKKEEISHLMEEVNRLNGVLKTNLISEEFLNELIESITISDTLFMEKFELVYPNFFSKINSISLQPLNQSDLKYCALIKLGYSTKQIAIYTNTTIKSVESRKYRIRKKLNIPSDMPHFIENL